MAINVTPPTACCVSVSEQGNATWQQNSSPRYSPAYTMHALTPYIHLLQNYIGVRLQHIDNLPVLSCTIHMLVADSTKHVSVKAMLHLLLIHVEAAVH